MSCVVPPCPKGLSFERDNFLTSDFSTDAFLSQRCGGAGGLEKLRDGFGFYLKVLRSSMIELINEDYADFVNLSTNLVGLEDQLHQGLEAPLKRYEGQVAAIQKLCKMSLLQLEVKLEKKAALRRQRATLQNMEHITLTLNKIERLLFVSTGALDLVERIAVDVHHLQHCITKCLEESAAFVEKTRPRLNEICSRLHATMESQLLDAVREQRVVSLRRCLRIYNAVDRVAVAEELVRKRVVAPFLEVVISEGSLTADPQGLKGVFQRIFKFVITDLGPLLELTTPVKGSDLHVLRDFDFLVRSLWPEIVDKFQNNLSFVFFAGNPEKFHQHYCHAMEFLDEFETKLFAETVDQFRSSPSYVSFVNRWNLSVYYQIRFQDIALPVEVATESLTEKGECGKFRLPATVSTFLALKKVWNPSVFLFALLPKFAKLTVQIVSRYASAVVVRTTDIACQQLAEEHPGLIQNASSVQLAQPQKKKGHYRHASDQHLEVNGAEEKQGEDAGSNLILIYLDVAELSDYLRQEFLLDLVLPTLADLPEQADQAMECMKSTLIDSSEGLSNTLPKLSQVIVSSVVSKALPFLDQVSDIPRLYRRTNRGLPSNPCSYVTSVLLPVRSFYTEICSRCPSHLLAMWCVEIVTLLADKYLSNVVEVLAAVQKMEESLRRLKRVRDMSSANSNPVADTLQKGEKGVSDDDKIRMQLYVDVRHFSQQVVEQFCIGKASVAPLLELDKMVADATKSSFSEPSDNQ